MVVNLFVFADEIGESIARLWLQHKIPLASLLPWLIAGGTRLLSGTTVSQRVLTSCQLRDPPVWPSYFVLVQRRIPDRDSRVGSATTVTYYDFEAGSNLIQITPDNNSEPILWDLELNNHQSFYFEPELLSCKPVHFPVGVVRPNFLEGATPLGKSKSEFTGREVCGWTKLDFIDYYADYETNQPSHWYFHSMKATFATVYYDDRTKPDASLFVPPEYCVLHSN